MTNKLPQGWVECEFESVIDVRDGTHDSPKYYETGYPLVTSKCLKNGNIDLSIASLISENDYHKINERSKVSIGDVLFAMIGTIGNPVLIQDEPSFAIKNVALFRKSNAVIPEFLKYYLESSNVLSVMQLQSKGSTQKFVGLGYLRKFNFLLPPLNEQKRIVEKIEEEFGKIDEGIEKLKLAQEQIKQYRQSVLKSAFDGKLYKTTEWEEKTLEKLTKKIGDVDHKMPKEVDYGIPYISPKDFYSINGINLKNAKKISNSDYEVLSRKIAPEMGDIIFPRYGTIGVLRYVDTNEKFLVSYSCAVIKTDTQKGNRRYLYYYLLSPQIKSQIQKSIRQTTQANIGIQSIKDFKIKIGTLDEQKQIVKEIEKRFEVADEVERVITENLAKAEQLKQSILKKAFEGRLVPQDPTDQPVSELLAQIQAERNK